MIGVSGCLPTGRRSWGGMQLWRDDDDLMHSSSLWPCVTTASRRRTAQTRECCKPQTTFQRALIVVVLFLHPRVVIVQLQPGTRAVDTQSFSCSQKLEQQTYKV